MFATTREIVSKNKAVPAFGFSTAEMARAIVETCEEQNQDVILMTSMSEAEFLGLEVAVGIAKALGQRATISVSLHLDHAKELTLVEKALSVGYSSVLADGSHLSFDRSVEFAREITKNTSLTRADVVVEVSLTELERAVELVEKARPDLLAPFSIQGGRDKTEIDKIMLVRKFVKTPLVLHNASSKSDEEIKTAIALGVVKINWNTCLREVWSKTLRQTLKSQPDEIKPYNILRPSVAAVRKVVEEKISLLKSEIRNPKFETF
jgi:fructose/tagatose bisphosphate aldolase